MTILLDDKPLDTDTLPPDATVGQLIESAKALLCGSGSMIVAVRHQNEDVTDKDLDRMLALPVADYDDLELVTGRPKQVVLAALKDVHGAFTETFAVVKDVADQLTAGNVAEAMTALTACVGVWAHTHGTIVQGGSLLGVRFDDLQLADQSAVQWLNDLVAKLRELKDAIEARDHVLLGDILRYEFDETLEQWERMLDGFIAHVEGIEEVIPAAGA